MDTLFFFRERLGFIRGFYDDASSVFTNRMSRIEAGEPPYDEPDDAIRAYDEPPYQAEWAGSKEALEVLGLTCVSMLSASLHAYVLAWEADLGVGLEPKKRSRLVRKQGVAGYFREMESLLNLPSETCPADLDLMEQVTLARNAVQHPARLRDMVPQHPQRDLKKNPRPFFMSAFERGFLEGELADVSFLVPRVRASREQLLCALDEAEKLAIWWSERLQATRNSPHQKQAGEARQ